MVHPEPDPHPDLVAHIVATAGLPEQVARRVIGDVIAFHAQPLDEFVVRRHRELAADGLRNPDIYEQLRREVNRRLFRGPDCSVRQIRRIIYG